MCEVGVWKSYEELEDNLTLDELFLLYEQATERQTRLMKTIGAAMGADMSGDSGGDNHIEYTTGNIAAGNDTILGYRTKVVEPGEET